MVLRSDLPSPLAPVSDDEKVDTSETGEGGQGGSGKNNGQGAGGKGAAPQTEVKIDFDSIGQRILALPVPAENYLSLQAGKAGEIYMEVGPQFQSVLEARSQPTPPFSVVKFDLKSRKTEPVISGISDFILSFNGEKFLYRKGRDRWGITSIASTAKSTKPDERMLNLDEMSVWIVPQEEWKQMYHEVWRIERDFLYDKNLHGLNLQATEAEYAKFLPGIASRNDLDYLFSQMLAQINVSHMFVRKAIMRDVPRVSDGLLGADYTIDRGRYRFANVFAGENWNPELNASLTQPGVNVKAGDYLLAVNGHELRGTDNIYSFFLNTAEKQVVLKVGPNPDGSGSRDVTVVPISSEADLRNRAWIEQNIKTVDRLSDGQLAYAYLPDTANGGYTNFNRYYLAQVGKHGAVIDERFNSGGAAADYIIEHLQRKPWNYWYSRHGNVFPTPFDAIYGPKAMIINQYSGSGGDMLPWFFHHADLGPLVGERTYGGLVAIYDYPTLIGGGSVTAPRLAFFNMDGQWDVENHGVSPDVEVELDPKAWRQGHDTQLERAVEMVTEELKKNPPKEPAVPPFPNYNNKP
jgi:tricorn protease